VAQLLPGVDLGMLAYYMDKVPRPGVLMSLLLNMNEPKIVEYPSRGNGGVIPDPRIQGEMSIEDAFAIAVLKTNTQYPRAIETPKNPKEHEEQAELIHNVKVRYHAKQLEFEQKLKTVSPKDRRQRAKLSKRIGNMQYKFKATTVAELIEEAMLEKDDYLYQSIYPPRSPGDLVIRRTRYDDYVPHFQQYQVELLNNCVGQDYIFVLNKIVASLAADDKWRRIYCKALTLKIEPYNVLMTELTDILKANNLEEGWQMYAEGKNLTGHRLPPWPGFDALEETRTLAEGGVEKHYPGGYIHRYAEVLGNVPEKQQNRMNFEQYINSGIWITAGASSEGILEVIINDGEDTLLKVRCKKNMLPDAYTMAELYQGCKQSTRQISKAFIKPETGKCRIAVCSDIYTYLKMAYIAYRSGFAYQNWSHITRNMSNLQKIAMMRKTLQLCRTGCFGMAWDYKGFERQVKTADLIAIVQVLINETTGTVDSNDLAEWAWITTNVQASFNHAIIIALTGEEFDVTGGLPSGLLFTSVCGDGYNKTMADTAMQIASKLTAPPTLMDDLNLMGDDASYMSYNVKYLQLIDYLMTAVGAIAGTGRFGIVLGSTEFLRVSYTKYGAKGYFMRAISGTVTGKPWTDMPTSPISEVVATLDAIDTVQRRGGNLEFVKDTILAHWCKSRNTTIQRACAPLIRGGLGIGRPIPDVVFNTKLNKPKRPMKVITKTVWRQNKWQHDGEELGIPLTDIQAAQLAQSELMGIVSSDTIPKVDSVVKNMWKTEIEALRGPSKIYQPLGVTINYEQLKEDADQYYATQYPKYANTFASQEKEKGIIEKIRVIAKAAELDVEHVLENRVPQFTHRVKSLTNMTRKDAEAWLLGDLPVYTSPYNPTCHEFIKRATANQISTGRVPRGRLVDVWIQVQKHVLDYFVRQTTDFTELFSW